MQKRQDKKQMEASKKCRIKIVAMFLMMAVLVVALVGCINFTFTTEIIENTTPPTTAASSAQKSYSSPIEAYSERFANIPVCTVEGETTAMVLGQSDIGQYDIFVCKKVGENCWYSIDDPVNYEVVCFYQNEETYTTLVVYHMANTNDYYLLFSQNTVESDLVEIADNQGTNFVHCLNVKDAYIETYCAYLSSFDLSEYEFTVNGKKLDLK